MSYNGWSSKSAWELAVYIDNNESLYNDACLIIDDYESGIYYLSMSVGFLSDRLGAHDIGYTFNDVKEYIVSRWNR
jgi:hypothetical protein